MCVCVSPSSHIQVGACIICATNADRHLPGSISLSHRGDKLDGCIRSHMVCSLSLVEVANGILCAPRLPASVLLPQCDCIQFCAVGLWWLDGGGLQWRGGEGSYVCVCVC